MILQKVRNFINQKRLVERYDKIAIGVSGGSDSVALLHILREIKEEYNLCLNIVHINYMLRGEESIEDEVFVKKLALSYKLPFYLRRVILSQERGVSLQEEAREKRYQYFIEKAYQLGANKLALGHIYDDQTETILMRLISGTGPEGFKGMPVRRKLSFNLEIIRPLLILKRQEVKEYLKRRQFSYRLDSSNLKTTYKRNKIRLMVLPKIREINPNFDENLRKTAYLWQEDHKFLEELAKRHQEDLIVKESSKEVILNNEVLKKLSFCLKSRIIKRILERFIENIKKIKYYQVDNILRLAEGSPHAEIVLPNKVRVYRDYQYLTFTQRSKEEIIDYEYLIEEVPNKVYLDKIKAKMEFKVKITPDKVIDNEVIDNIGFDKKVFDKNKLEINLDYDKIKLPLKVRNRRRGDRFYPLGLKGSKKVKDYLIDKKVSIFKRNKIPLVVDRGKILWIASLEISELAKIDKDTKKILQITYLPEMHSTY